MVYAFRTGAHSITTCVYTGAYRLCTGAYKLYTGAYEEPGTARAHKQTGAQQKSERNRQGVHAQRMVTAPTPKSIALTDHLKKYVS